jgi:hypothetical protein
MANRNEKGQFVVGHKTIGNVGRKRGSIPWNKGLKGKQIAWNKGIKTGLTPWNKGKKGLREAWNKGKRNVEMSLRQIGKNNPCWKGGIAPENKKIRTSIEYRLWRETVFARDNWTCQKTMIKGEKLHPHHIHNFADFPELRFAIVNGITLSEKSHREFHKKYGRKSNNQEQINEFLNYHG